MRAFFISFICTTTLVGGMLFASHYKTQVKYSQIFAEKKITLTETMTVQAKLSLRNKKGFVAYE